MAISVAGRVCPPRAGAFCSTVTVASWSCSAGNSIIDSRVGFGLRVVMWPRCSFRATGCRDAVGVAGRVRDRSDVVLSCATVYVISATQCSIRSFRGSRVATIQASVE